MGSRKYWPLSVMLNRILFGSLPAIRAASLHPTEFAAIGIGYDYCEVAIIAHGRSLLFLWYDRIFPKPARAHIDNLHPEASTCSSEQAARLLSPECI